MGRPSSSRARAGKWSRTAATSNRAAVRLIEAVYETVETFRTTPASMVVTAELRTPQAHPLGGTRIMAQTNRRTRIASVAGLALAAAMFTGAPLVAARGDDIVRRGDCTGASDWKLKLSPENGRIEVEFEVDQNRN